MSRIIKKVICKKSKPETMSDFQALLDTNKEKLSDKDYLALCNGMKAMFEEKEKQLIFTQVRIMYPEVVNRPDSQPIIKMSFRREIIHIKQSELDKLIEELKNNNIVEFRHMSKDYHVIFDIDTDKLCSDCEENKQQEQVITGSEYITHVYPKEEWVDHTQACGHQYSSWGISHIHIHD